jgi:hypothetical protein
MLALGNGRVVDPLNTLNTLDDHNRASCRI